MRLIPESPRLSRVGRRLTLCSVLHCMGFFMRCSLRKTTGGLLPRLFTLIPHTRDGMFSVTLSVDRSLRHGRPRFRTACCLQVFGLSSGPANKSPNQRSSTTPTIYMLAALGAMSGEGVQRRLARMAHFWVWNCEKTWSSFRAKVKSAEVRPLAEWVDSNNRTVRHRISMSG